MHSIDVWSTGAIEVEVLRARGRRDQDRVAVHAAPGGARVVLADGAGGFGDGRMAAELAVSEASREGDASAPAAFCARLDRRLVELGGETTLVVLRVASDAADGAIGFVVGDSRVWAATCAVGACAVGACAVGACAVGACTALAWSSEVESRARLGSGRFARGLAVPSTFARSTCAWLLASDGAVDWLREDALACVLRGERTLASLASSMRRPYESDDATVVVVRRVTR